VLAVCVCLALTGPAAVALGADGTAPPSAQLTDFSCQRAVDPLLRGMSVAAVMRPIPATRQMQMKAVLLKASRRLGHYRVVPHLRDLDHWISPTDPTLGQRPADVWRVIFPVVGLPAPAFYRLRISFRWIELARRVLATRTLSTSACHQLELRPDLVASSLTVKSAAGGEDRYVAVVRDRGLTGAGPFAVQLNATTGILGTQTVTWLGSHVSKRLVFLAPACTSGSGLTLAVDPDEQVLDYDRANNTLSITCPDTGSGSAAAARRPPLH
jgi:hypothetical protein